MHRYAALISAPLLAISTTSCDGPHERAGEKADVSAGATDSESSIRSGPAEKEGERRDAAERKEAGRR